MLLEQKEWDDEQKEWGEVHNEFNDKVHQCFDYLQVSEQDRLFGEAALQAIADTIFGLVNEINMLTENKNKGQNKDKDVPLVLLPPIQVSLLYAVIRDIDVILTSIIEINHILFRLSYGDKAIKRYFKKSDRDILLAFRKIRSKILAHPLKTYRDNDKNIEYYVFGVCPYFEEEFSSLMKKCDYVLKIQYPDEKEYRVEPLYLSKQIYPALFVLKSEMQRYPKDINTLSSKLQEFQTDKDLQSIEEHRKWIKEKLCLLQNPLNSVEGDVCE